MLKRAPGDLDALNNIAWIRATHVDPVHRNGAEAVVLAEQARDAPHDPNHVLFSTLAAAYAEVGRFDDAVRAAERAIELARVAERRTSRREIRGAARAVPRGPALPPVSDYFGSDGGVPMLSRNQINSSLSAW